MTNFEFVFSLLVILLGLGLMLAAANVFYRDVEAVLDPFLIAWFFATPILYDLGTVFSRELMGVNLGWLVHALNPMASFITSYRIVLMGGARKLFLPNTTLGSGRTTNTDYTISADIASAWGVPVAGLDPGRDRGHAGRRGAEHEGVPGRHPERGGDRVRHHRVDPADAHGAERHHRQPSLLLAA